MQIVQWFLAIVFILALMGKCSGDETAAMCQNVHRHWGFESDVKKLLRDPDSYEHEKTKVRPHSENLNKIEVYFRSRNGFGGMTGGVASGLYNTQTCAHEVVTCCG